MVAANGSGNPNTEAYNKMVGERQRAAIAKAHTKKVPMGSYSAPLPHPLSTTSSREKISASPKVVESSTPIKIPSSYVVKTKVTLESSHTSSKFQAPANPKPLTAKRPASLNPPGGESSLVADEHPITLGTNGVEVPDLNSSDSPFIRAFLEAEKRRDIGDR
jgi:hypothetical protein